MRATSPALSSSSCAREAPNETVQSSAGADCVSSVACVGSFGTSSASFTPKEFVPPLQAPTTHIRGNPPFSADPPPLTSIGDQTWMSSNAYRRLCEQSQGPNARPVRVLGVSLFDGVGSFWEVFAPFVGRQMTWVGQWSSETDPDALRVLNHRHPSSSTLVAFAKFRKRGSTTSCLVAVLMW